MDSIFYTFIVLMFVAVVLAFEAIYVWWNSRHGPAARRIDSRIRALSAGGHVSKERLSILKNDVLKDGSFFEKLMPAGGTDAVAIRGLQAEVLGGSQLRWQVLVIQAQKNAPEFRGRLQLLVAGTLDGKPWSMDLPVSSQDLRFRQYRRLEGLVDLPDQAVVQNVSAKVVEGTATRAVQSIRLGA